MKTTILQNIKAIVLGLLIAVGVGYVSADWSNPASAPTGGNTPAPINVSANAQIKDGTLTLGGLGVVGNFTFLPGVGQNPADGQVLTADGTSGKVKWSSVAGGGGSSTGPVTGSVIGGCTVTASGGYPTAWGSASDSGGNCTCPSGSTFHNTYTTTAVPAEAGLCIKN